ncbi:MAG: hypothetical protein ACO1SX_20280 [Actinomycetota bacterium]
MTINEALEAIDDGQACWIVWNTDSGEILAVSSLDPDASPEERARLLQELSGFDVPVKARYFGPGDVTRQALLHERDETDRVKTRKSILTGWAAASVEELVAVLERGEYPPPMQKDFDSRVIVDHLWSLHRAEWDDAVQSRLRAMLESEALCSSASRNLEAYLHAMSGNEATLVATWRRERPGQEVYADTYVLMECFAHVQTSDRGVVNDIIAMVETPGMFGPRHEAMKTLGRLGAVTGPRAADAIRRSIYESSPAIAAERSRVLQRIETPAADWERCQSCCYGCIHRAGGHGEASCPSCLGLGYLLKPSASRESDR